MLLLMFTAQIIAIFIIILVLVPKGNKQQMDHIKVKLRSPNKRSLKRISRNQWLDFSNRHKINISEERAKVSRSYLGSQNSIPNCKVFSGVTLEDYIRGNSPTQVSPQSKVIKLELKEVKLNFPRRTEIEEIDEDDYDESLVHRHNIDHSLPKIQRFSVPTKNNLKIRSSSRVQHNHDGFGSLREERVRTVYNEPMFLNAHKSVSAKKAIKDSLLQSSTNNSKTEKFARFKLESPYLVTSAGFMVGLSKKKNRKIIRSQFRHIE